MTPQVSIIILNWNGLKDTIECLESLKRITYPNYEVIVVDNGSEGNGADVLEERYGNYIRLIRNKENLGYAGGNNVAIKKVLEEGRSDYLWILNNDTVIEDEDILRLFLGAMNQNPQIGVVGPAIYDYKSKKIQTEWTKLNLFSGRIEFVGQGREVPLLKEGRALKGNEFLTGSSLFIRKEVLRRNLFPEFYFLYYEESDWEKTIRKNGWLTYYLPKTKVFHKGAASLGGYGNLSLVSDYYDSRNFLYFIKKFYALLLPYEILTFIKNRMLAKILRGEWLRLKHVLMGLKDFLRGKTGKR